MNLTELLKEQGVAPGKINAIVQKTIRKLIRNGKVSQDGKITCSEEEFANIAVDSIPKSEMKRLASKAE